MNTLSYYEEDEPFFYGNYFEIPRTRFYDGRSTESYTLKTLEKVNERYLANDKDTFDRCIDYVIRYMFQAARKAANAFGCFVKCNATYEELRQYMHRYDYYLALALAVECHDHSDWSSEPTQYTVALSAAPVTAEITVRSRFDEIITARIVELIEIEAKADNLNAIDGIWVKFDRYFCFEDCIGEIIDEMRRPFSEEY